LRANPIPLKIGRFSSLDPCLSSPASGALHAPDLHNGPSTLLLKALRATLCRRIFLPLCRPACPFSVFITVRHDAGFLKVGPSPTYRLPLFHIGDFLVSDFACLKSLLGINYSPARRYSPRKDIHMLLAILSWTRFPAIRRASTLSFLGRFDFTASLPRYHAQSPRWQIKASFPLSLYVTYAPSSFAAANSGADLPFPRKKQSPSISFLLHHKSVLCATLLHSMSFLVSRRMYEA